MNGYIQVIVKTGDESPVQSLKEIGVVAEMVGIRGESSTGASPPSAINYWTISSYEKKDLSLERQVEFLVSKLIAVIFRIRSIGRDYDVAINVVLSGPCEDINIPRNLLRLSSVLCADVHLVYYKIL